MKRKRVFIAIAFGTSVRDVLRTDILGKLKQQPNLDIVVFMQELNESIIEEFGSFNVSFEKIKPFTPSLWERILLNLHRALLREKCRSIDIGNTAGDTSSIDKISPFVKLLRTFISYKRFTKIIFFLYRFAKVPKLYNSEFDKYSPDLVVVTRVLNYSQDYPFLRVAASRKIPVIGLVSSWDNLTSKAFFPFNISSLVVWNEVMKAEAMSLFDFPEDKIFISGIPRYDIFFQKLDLISKVDFCRKMGLDLNKKIILYCTGSAQTGPSKLGPSPQPYIAKFIAESINQGFFDMPVQLLIRLHPQANPNDYLMLNEFASQVVIHMPGRTSNFHDRLFSQKDDIEFAESLYYCDVLLNLASTATIDGAVFNKPIVCENIDLWGYKDIYSSVQRFYEFDHFAKLGETNGFDLVRTKEELIAKINFLLENPLYKEFERKKIVEQQCYYSDGKSGLRVAEHIIKTLNED
jgi:hypothetical protein